MRQQEADVTYEELIAELTQRAIVDKERKAERDRLIEEVNTIRDQRAASEAKERFGIEPEMYIRRGDKVYQVKSLSIGHVNEYAFRGGYEFKESDHRDRDNSIAANCWPITAIGKPLMQRGRYRDGYNATETIPLHEKRPVIIVPESEIAVKSKRADASEAKRKFAGLSDEQIAAALKAAGIK